MCRILINLLFILIILYPFRSKSQCKTTITEKTVTLLDKTKYNKATRTNTAFISEGESLKIFKTFYRGLHYRLVICADEQLPGVDLKIATNEEFIYETRKKGKNIHVWDFQMEHTQRLIIFMSVPKTNKTPEKGCIGILFGIKKH